jgi:hypothetical protein
LCGKDDDDPPGVMAGTIPSELGVRSPLGQPTPRAPADGADMAADVGGIVRT